MSWRHFAEDAQDVMLDTFAERDDADEVTTEIDEGNGNPFTALRLIWRDAWVELLAELERPISTREIRADAMIRDLPAYPPAHAWRVRVRRPLEGDPRDDSAVVEFEIADHQPDGEGIVRLHLRRPRAPASSS